MKCLPLPSHLYSICMRARMHACAHTEKEDVCVCVRVCAQGKEDYVRICVCACLHRGKVCVCVCVHVSVCVQHTTHCLAASNSSWEISSLPKTVHFLFVQISIFQSAHATKLWIRRLVKSTQFVTLLIGHYDVNILVALLTLTQDRTEWQFILCPSAHFERIRQQHVLCISACLLLAKCLPVCL